MKRKILDSDVQPYKKTKYNHHQEPESLTKRLNNKLQQQEEVINQDITIRDIYVYPEETNGERTIRSIHENAEYPYLRVIKHIEILAAIANEYHKQYYCE